MLFFCVFFAFASAWENGFSMEGLSVDVAIDDCEYFGLVYVLLKENLHLCVQGYHKAKATVVPCNNLFLPVILNRASSPS